MNQEQIKSIFSQGYNRSNWNKFLSEAFSGAKIFISPEPLLDIDSNIAKSAYQLGNIVINEKGIERKISVFEVTLADGIVLERNRVGLRNLLRKYWKNLDAAFIAYSKSSSQKWRFTYVSELSDWDAEGEFISVKTEPKRYTYVLGEGESIRTACERFASIAAKGSKAELSDIKDAFSVEKLSKSFFDEYKKQYTEFCKYMTAKPNIYAAIFNGDEKAIRDFNKKLLGRIVFLYFIQKKGWLGVPLHSDWGQGDYNFLTRQFDNFRNKDLFYRDFLSVLFFETLNRNRDNDLFNYDNSKFITMPENDIVKIPYLNGGLFEEENIKHREIILDSELFRSLFDFFNQYNFTIYEDDPNDHTVAVDPEMLGHIFENLLEDNKDKGAFYTPKEIVHYMCQESLIEYLCTKLKIEDEAKERQAITDLLKKKEIDEILKPEIQNINEALETVKICDPAIGSGAFPMGLLHEIFLVKQTLWGFQYGSLNDFPASDIKLNIIQNSIYGVDIEKGAVDIARLRFWLSLIVDEQSPKPLPNLDYKIVTGNSLVSKFGDDILEIDWDLNETVQENIFGSAEIRDQKKKIIQKIIKEQKEYFNPNSDKKILAEDVRKLKIDLLINQLQLMVKTKGLSKMPDGLKGKAHKEATELFLQTQSWKQSITELNKLKSQPGKALDFFDWKLDFPEIMNEYVNPNTGFDIVIGNPPYVQLQKDGGNLAKQFENLNYQTFAKTGDIYSLFYEKGINLLRKDGNLIFITSNKWMRAGYGEKLREFFTKYQPLILIDLGPGVFESATVDTNILLIKKNTNSNNLLAVTIIDYQIINI